MITESIGCPVITDGRAGLGLSHSIAGLHHEFSVLG